MQFSVSLETIRCPIMGLSCPSCCECAGRVVACDDGGEVAGVAVLDERAERVACPVAWAFGAEVVEDEQARHVVVADDRSSVAISHRGFGPVEQFDDVDPGWIFFGPFPVEEELEAGADERERQAALAAADRPVQVEVRPDFGVNDFQIGWLSKSISGSGFSSSILTNRPSTSLWPVCDQSHGSTAVMAARPASSWVGNVAIVHACIRLPWTVGRRRCWCCPCSSSSAKPAMAGFRSRPILRRRSQGCTRGIRGQAS